MGSDMNTYLRLNPMGTIVVCILALIIIAIAEHFFWDKVLTYLDVHKAAIRADIDADTQSREVGEQYERQYEKQMASTRDKAREILEGAKASAVQGKREILAATRDEVEVVEEKTRENIGCEKVQARAEMKDAVVNVASEAAKQITNKELDESTHKQRVSNSIEHADDKSRQT